MIAPLPPKPVKITELVLRDAHQSLLATRMRTEDMLPICEKLDDVGYWSLEVWGGATFDACLRFLGEDPWERLRQLRKALPKTPLQMLLRGQNILGYRHYADDVVERFVAKSIEYGMNVFRIFDAVNDLRNIETAVRVVLKGGQHAQGAICYTVSPVHTLEKFVEQARQIEAMGCQSLVIKDMAALMLRKRQTNHILLMEAVGGMMNLRSGWLAGQDGTEAWDCAAKGIAAGCPAQPISAAADAVNSFQWSGKSS